MNTTTHLFDRYKEALGVHSDRQAAMRLGVKVQTVSNWRTRGSQAEAATIDAMCHQLKEDPMPWLLRIQAEQGGEDSRNGRVWQRVATQLGVPLSMALVAVESAGTVVAGGLDLVAGSTSGALSLMAPVGRLLPLLGM